MIDQRKGPVATGPLSTTSTCSLQPGHDTAANGATLAQRLTQALELAFHGVPVFPCWPDTKAPATPHAFYDATTDARKIRYWWRSTNFVLAFRTGIASHILLIDEDPKPGSAEWVAEHAAILTCGRMHRTKRGWHRLYRYDGDPEIRCSAGKLAPGIDVRCEGGYALWHPAFGREVIGDFGDIAPATPALMELLSAAQRPPRDPLVVPLASDFNGKVLALLDRYKPFQRHGQPEHKYELTICPFAEKHTGTDLGGAFVQLTGAETTFFCNHSHGSGPGSDHWEQLLALLDPSLKLLIEYSSLTEEWNVVLPGEVL